MTCRIGERGGHIAVHVDVVWHPVVNIMGASRQGKHGVQGRWTIIRGFSRDLVLLALVPGNRYSWDCLGYCLYCASSNRPFALHRLPEGALRAIIIENAAT